MTDNLKDRGGKRARTDRRKDREEKIQRPRGTGANRCKECEGYVQGKQGFGTVNARNRLKEQNEVISIARNPQRAVPCSAQGRVAVLRVTP